tara:strand:- start:312 stop:890 length:579 start_codon:yes stop_codon:yes gene_type:complete
MKLCSDCSKEKDGNHSSYCKSCMAKRTVGYRQNNKEKIRESDKKYYQNNKEKVLEQKKEYYQNNREKLNEQHKEYYQNNKEKNKEQKKEYRKEYHKNNPHKVRESNRKRRALKQRNIHKPYTEDQVLNLYGSVCHICKEEINLSANRSIGSLGWEKGLHLDHVIPLSKGGPDTIENVKPSHGLCNLSKSASV